MLQMTVCTITPRRFDDDRGWFSETWNAQRYAGLGVAVNFCQDNHSLSRHAGTVRGLHFQHAPHAQAKLVRCQKGRVYDVAVDIRRQSPTYKQWVGVELSAELGNQIFIPAGFAHGFLTLEPDCEVSYKVDAFYAVESEGGFTWDDPELGIQWPLGNLTPMQSAKDAALPRFSEAKFDFPYDGQPLLPLNR
jgi:dTDP-4-dehydrorhamnose 3,5-epimerase